MDGLEVIRDILGLLPPEWELTLDFDHEDGLYGATLLTPTPALNAKFIHRCATLEESIDRVRDQLLQQIEENIEREIAVERRQHEGRARRR